MKVKHHYDFGPGMGSRIKDGALSEENWDLLRMDAEGGPFALESSREEYLENCRRAGKYRRHAQCILEEMGGRRDLRLCSLGAGKGVLEWHIKNLFPECYMCCTDYAGESLERLKALFPECDEMRQFDMIKGDYSQLCSFDALILYRVSTEFSPEQWREIFRKMYGAGIGRVVLIPTELMGVKDVARELLLRLRSALHRRKLTFCGWLYSEKELRRLFAPQFRVSGARYIDNTAVYCLESV